MDIEASKKAAVDFLQLVTAGKIEDAYKKHVDMKGKHHNTFTPAGFPALRKGMLDAAVKFPKIKFTVKHVIGDGDLVAVHSHLVLKEGEMEFSSVHMFRFDGGKIVEMWDSSQQLQADMPNKDGAF